MILHLFTLIGALGMFLNGMNFMSAGLQKASGDKLRGILEVYKKNVETLQNLDIPENFEYFWPIFQKIQYTLWVSYRFSRSSER